MKEWRTISSRLAYHKRRVRILEDIVELPSGEQTDYIVLQGGEAVAVLPLTGQGRVVLTRQYRYPIKEALLELPGGGSMRGESPEESARRELQEETGYRAGRLTFLGSFFPSPSRATTRVHVFVADRLQPGPSGRDANEFIEVEELDWHEVVRLVLDNEVKDLTLAWSVLMLETRRMHGPR